MPRTESKAVPGHYGSVPHDDYEEVGRLTIEQLIRIVTEEMGEKTMEGQATSAMKDLKTRKRRARQISV